MKLPKAAKEKPRLREKGNVTHKPATGQSVTVSGNEVTDTAKEKQKLTHYKQANQNKK